MLLLLIFHLGFTQVKSEPITAASFKSADNLTILDVRTAAEFADGHLDNAINITWPDPAFVRKVQPLDKSKPVYVYCQKGGRSEKAATLLDSLGYKVINLSGGFAAWKSGSN